MLNSVDELTGGMLFKRQTVLLHPTNKQTWIWNWVIDRRKSWKVTFDESSKDETIVEKVDVLVEDPNIDSQHFNNLLKETKTQLLKALHLGELQQYLCPQDFTF